jgi:SRSO17 transposase
VEDRGWATRHQGRLSARFAALRARVADGPAQRIGDKGSQHMPGEEVWLVGEHRSSGERKYYLSNLPAETELKTLAATIKARWVCEQAHQRLKEELGLDHFEGRSWTGLHRHTLMTLIALAFLQHQRLAAARRGKKDGRAATPAKLAGGAPSSRGAPHGPALATTAPSLPTLPAMAQLAPAHA